MNMRLSYGMGFILLLMPCSLLVAFTHYPAAKALLNSFWNNGSSFRPSRFVGLKNYETLLEDDKLMQVLINSFIYAIGTVPLAIALAIGMALLVNSKLPATGLMRLSFFLPTMLPMVAVANIWLFFYAPGIGLASQLLNAVGLPSINFLGSTETSLASMMVVAVWKEAGLFMIFYLAALQSLPPELEEAGRIEGASRWYFFWRVTFPLLMPTTLFVLVNATINSFKLVDHLFILTKGGPDNASSLLLYYVYQVAFSFFETNYAATLTVMLLAMLAVLALLQFLLIEKRVHYR